MAEIDTEEALVVDDKQRLELKVGDHFRAAVLPSREGGKLEVRFRDIKHTVYGLGDYAFVSTPDGNGIVLREGQSVVLIFAAHAQLQEGLSKILKAATAKAAKLLDLYVRNHPESDLGWRTLVDVYQQAGDETNLHLAYAESKALSGDYMRAMRRAR